MRKIAITVAPVGAHQLEGVKNPLTPEEIAEDVIKCHENGASQVHLHVRDKDGSLTSDISIFSKSVEMICQKTDLIIQGSTGGLSSLTRDERCASLLEPRVEVASLNMGTVNFGDVIYINTLDDIRYWSKRIKEANALPELEIFEPGMIYNTFQMIREGVLPENNIYSFSLGIGPLPCSPHSLYMLSGLIPPGSLWGCIHTGMTDFSMLAAAIGMGASMIRVGFEDSTFYSPGKAAQTNAELVGRAADMIRCMGLEVATPEEARIMFHNN